MPNVNAVLAQEITRLSKRVVNTSTKSTRKLVTQHRRDVAALKRQVAELLHRLAAVEKRQPREIAAPPELLEKARFRAMGVKAHRAKLGLSARDYGKLVGVSELTIYHWESGKARPRNKRTVAQWLAVRGLGKRDALQRLGVDMPKANRSTATPSPKKRRTRGAFTQTAEEMIVSLLKGRRMLTTRQLASAWKKAGRGGSVDNTLSRMVKARALKRKPLGGKRGSEYRAA